MEEDATAQVHPDKAVRSEQRHHFSVVASLPGPHANNAPGGHRRESGTHESCTRRGPSSFANEEATMDNNDEPRRKLVADIAKVRAELEEAKALHSTGAQRKIWFLEET
jgi:hypothetical protein